MNEYIEQTTRTKLKRLPKRGNFERETVYRILDEAFVCHVGFCREGQPFVIPINWRSHSAQLVVCLE